MDFKINLLISLQTLALRYQTLFLNTLGYDALDR